MTSLITYSVYPILPSAFQLIERPLYWLNGEDNKIKYSENKDRNQLNRLSAKQVRMNNLDSDISQTKRKIFQALNQRQFSKVFTLSKCVVSLWLELNASYCKTLVLLTATSVISVPIVLLTPLTIIADIFIGAIEAIVARFNNASSEQALLILQKKCLSSPLQQFTFLGLSISVTAMMTAGSFHVIPPTLLNKKIIGALILANSFLNLKCYEHAQRIIGNHFPQWAKPDDFNIFIDGGAPDEFGRKFTAKAERDYQHYKKNYGNNYSGEWKDFITDLKLSENPPLGNNSKLLPFLTLLQENNPPPSLEKILGLQNEVITVEVIKKARLKLSLVLHPDKHPNVEENKVADKLFKAMFQACIILEKTCN